MDSFEAYRKGIPPDEYLRIAEKASHLDNEYSSREIIVNKHGHIRQAGSSSTLEGDFIKKFRKAAEASLYVFAKGVLGRDRLTTHLHRPGASWFTSFPPYRKLLLWPRDHYKTTLASQCLPIHILIQPQDNNMYFPDCMGTDTRILLACETESRAAYHLRWITSMFENNVKLRAMWPQCCWDEPTRQAKIWNKQSILLPRKKDFSDPSIQVKGVGGAVTGAHVNVMIKDDLISIEAANSPTVMQTAIDWHISSRALFDDPDTSLEFIIGTKWAVHDLYSYIIDKDPSVAVQIRSIIEDGKPILPELFSLPTIARLKTEFGILFPLLYMNSASDPELVDFSGADLREFKIENGNVIFEEDERDFILREKNKAPEIDQSLLRGQPLTPELLAEMSPRDTYFRLRAT